MLFGDRLNLIDMRKHHWLLLIMALMVLNHLYWIDFLLQHLGNKRHEVNVKFITEKYNKSIQK